MSARYFFPLANSDPSAPGRVISLGAAELFVDSAEPLPPFPGQRFQLARVWAGWSRFVRSPWPLLERRERLSWSPPELPEAQIAKLTGASANLATLLCLAGSSSDTPLLRSLFRSVWASAQLSQSGEALEPVQFLAVKFKAFLKRATEDPKGGEGFVFFAAQANSDALARVMETESSRFEVREFNGQLESLKHSSPVLVWVSNVQLPRLIEAWSAGVKPASAQWEGSPFRGLQVFEAEHEPIFFGRNFEAHLILDQLAAQRQQGRAFVLVLGASGVGKSSLLRAKVLPWLQRASRGPLLKAIMRPGLSAAPLRSLSDALTGPDVLPALKGEWPTKSSQVGRSVKEALLAQNESMRLVLLVDQLEELFSPPFEPAQRTAFFEVLSALAQSGVVDLLATLRSDFIDACEAHPTLMDLKARDGLVHLRPAGSSAIAQLIREPAKMAGLAFEVDEAAGALDDELIRAASGAPGALPLLQFTLDALYEAKEGSRLTWAAYRSLGSLSGAIAREAERSFSQMPKASQDALEPILPRLVSLSSDGRAVRQSADQETLTSLHKGAPELLRVLIDERRLLISDRDSGGARIVVMAHEALLSAWPRVELWVERNRDALNIRARLRQGAAIYETSKDPSYLWSRGRSFEEARTLVRSHRALLTASDLNFAKRSVRAGLLGRWVTRSMVAVVIVGLSVLAAMAYRGQEQAKAAERKAKRQFAMAEIQRQVRVGMRDKKVAPLHALEILALVKKEDIQVPEYAHIAMRATDESRRSSAAFSADGRFAAVTFADGAVRIWSLDDFSDRPLRLTGTSTGPSALPRAEFSLDNRRLAVSFEKESRVWDLQDLHAPPKTFVKTRIIGVGPNGRFLIEQGPLSMGLQLRDLDAPGAPTTLAHGLLFIQSLTFSPDSRYLMIFGRDMLAQRPLVKLFLTDGSAPARAFDPLIQRAAFSLDSSSLLHVPKQGPINVWNLADQKPMQPIQMGPLSDEFLGAEILGGRLLQVVDRDRNAQVWDLGALEAPQRFKREGIWKGAKDSALSPDGHLLATAGDLTVSLWNPQKMDAPLQTLKPPYKSTGNPRVGFRKDGRLLTFDPDGLIYFWRIKNKEAYWERSVRLWEMDTASIGKRICATLTLESIKAARLESFSNLSELVKRAPGQDLCVVLEKSGIIRASPGWP